MNRRGIRYLIPLLVLVLALGCGLLAPQSSESTLPVTPVESTPSRRDPEAPTPPAPIPAPPVVGLQETLTQLYDQVNPSVVYIVVSPRGSGSGFVYDAEGHIVTNDHVVAGLQNFEVVFWNGERRRATLIGSDPDSDLAVIQVAEMPEGAAPLPLADSAVLAVGQFVVALGSPFGEQGSMSFGIVSGLGRSLPSQRATTLGSTYSLPQVIQTDAPINPGNSGGPLLNLQGEVVGVNAAIATTTGANTGVGFSIPVDVVRRVIPTLITEGEMTYPYMGVSFASELSIDDQERFNLPQSRGAYVVGVVEGSPADAAGLIPADPRTGQGGDLIIELDGRPITNFADLNAYLVLEAEVGQTIQVTVLRGETRQQLDLTLGARP